MLIIFTILSILFLLQGFINADAAPLSAFIPRQTGIVPPFPQECVCPAANRSISDIVWSCVVTLFACSWVSVHPNNAGPGEKWWKRTFRRLELMFWSITTPELIVFWAMRQWAGARRLVQKYHEQGWTMTHGYFIQLGGFMLYDVDKALGVIGPDRLEDLLGKGMITMPSITEDDIQDRSKSDALSKALVILQTTWFILQCIGRRVEGLVITELELVTLAFAALNGVMYFLWWNKPLDVQSAVAIYLNPPTCSQHTPTPTAEGKPVETELTENRKEEPLKAPRPGLRVWFPLQTHKDVAQLHFDFRKFPHQALRFLSGVLFRWPAAGMLAIISRIGDICDCDVIDEGKMRVNTFYAYDPTPTKDFTREDFVPPGIAILFGAIHCAGWNFFFPSLAEAYIWRVSSAVIAGVPALWTVIILLLILYHGNASESLVLEYPVLVAIVTLVMTPLYFLGRLALLIAPLRNLPPGALEVVSWTSYLPHV